MNFSFCFLTARPCSVRHITGNVVVNTTTAAVTFSADDLGAVFRCKLDSARFEACTYDSYVYHSTYITS